MTADADYSRRALWDRLFAKSDALAADTPSVPPERARTINPLLLAPNRDADFTRVRDKDAQEHPEDFPDLLP